MHQVLSGKEHLSSAERRDILRKNSIKTSEARCQEEYKEDLNVVIQRVLLPNSTMLEKGLIVIPSNPTEEHWTATFIFHAAYIQDQTIGKPRACFL
jgi:hypothetical protein